MASRYLMQILDTQTGEVVSYEPGGHIEKAFAADCAARICDELGKTAKMDLALFVDDVIRSLAERRIGLFTPTDVVVQHVRDAINKEIVTGGLQQFTYAYLQEVKQIVHDTIDKSIFELKAKVRPS